MTAPTECQSRRKGDAAAAGRIRAFRDRMRETGRLLRDGLGFDVKPDPSDIVGDAYLIVVSLIVHALTTDKDAPGTAELAALSKVLAEQRRLDVQKLDVERKRARDGIGPAGVTPILDGVVNELYGQAPPAPRSGDATDLKVDQLDDGSAMI